MRAPIFAAPVRALCALAVFAACAPASHAALFEDSEARRAILELRQRIDSLQTTNQRAGDDLRRSGEDTTQLRRSLLEQGVAEETVLRREDLLGAAEVYLGNALRGLVPVEMLTA